ncbi:MAG: ABC transporter ATP-binding protein [Planctomycetota bacterium]|nr:ABC transporter ATP-binding protein [Planctomycetota bacterium]
MAFLKLENINRKFGSVVALDEPSPSSIEKGGIVVVLGPSGCGKTTLLRIVCGLAMPDTGSVFLDGERMNDVQPHKRDMAMVFQNYALYPHMTAGENLAFALRVASMPRQQINKRLTETATMLGITDLLDRFPSQCSGGQRQRIALGRALMKRPSLLLFDEPLSNLDAGLRETLRVELRSLVRQLGATALYVTHDQAEALTLGDKVLVMNGGRLQQYASPRSIYDEPSNAFVATFLGMPRINSFSGDVSNGLFRATDGFELPAPIRQGAAQLMIRPETLRISQNGPIQGELLSLEYQGDRTVLHLRAGETNFRCLERGLHKGVSEGQKLAFEVPADSCLWFDPETGHRITDGG